MESFVTFLNATNLFSLVVQVKYHMNVIYSLRDRHTHTPTLWTKAISRNQACLKSFYCLLNNNIFWLLCSYVCTWCRAFNQILANNVCNIKIFLDILSKVFEKFINKPLHGDSVQITISTAGPPQFFPPQNGTGLLQFLVFFLTQETEQFPTDQFDHPPSTIQLITTNIMYVHAHTRAHTRIHTHTHTHTHTCAHTLQYSNI